ncbi:hypothetical protein C9374_014150 [Naegleria lovaniensis]|uniref:DNA replication complex GINS protein PSF2 n=1 Tax=Naegleria lovaniensis TaxID=51637 RepID=A0AA88KN25_NAELO|nr:uncharacterized protein C9374_014150 [Naegleria lovaniensis]KAG2389590.1 hypothetical protein C9374_014150 [Naegleria lovaniensis]
MIRQHCEDEFLSNEELEYLAEETMISIRPTKNLPKIKMITHTIGPALANQEISVPLWAAIQLKKLNQCKIVIPEWLRVDWLEEASAQSSKSHDFYPMPPHFLEIGYLLLKVAKNDFDDNPEEISSLLKTLEDKRRDNLTDGLTKGIGDVEPTDYFPGYLLTNLSAMEMNRIRKATVEVLSKRDRYYRTSSTTAEVPPSSSQTHDDNDDEED